MGLSAVGVLALLVHLVVKKYRRGADERIHALSPVAGELLSCPGQCYVALEPSHRSNSPETPIQSPS